VSENVRVAVVGVGNNTSALVQGISLYRKTGNLTGVRSPEISGLQVDAIDFVAAFAMSGAKVGEDLHDAIFPTPTTFPDSMWNCRHLACR
jgi:myo-inositol-1-phosphate synthase